VLPRAVKVRRARKLRDGQMADTGVPHFHNDLGVEVIHVGSREFMCIGATPPFDHPHVFIDMGSDEDVICSYCGSHYKYQPALSAGEADPPGCLWNDHEQVA
jgi:uncharacterized Zn-finger protein